MFGRKPNKKDTKVTAKEFARDVDEAIDEIRKYPIPTGMDFTQVCMMVATNPKISEPIRTAAVLHLVGTCYKNGAHQELLIGLQNEIAMEINREMADFPNLTGLAQKFNQFVHSHGQKTVEKMQEVDNIVQHKFVPTLAKLITK